MLGFDTRPIVGADGLIIKLSGAADYDAAATLDAGLLRVSAARPAHVIIDVGALEFLNSGAIGRLVALRKEVLVRGGRVLVAGASRYVAECFRLSRLDHAFEMCPSVEDAQARLAG